MLVLFTDCTKTHASHTRVILQLQANLAYVFTRKIFFINIFDILWFLILYRITFRWWLCWKKKKKFCPFSLKVSFPLHSTHWICYITIHKMYVPKHHSKMYWDIYSFLFGSDFIINCFFVMKVTLWCGTDRLWWKL